MFRKRSLFVVTTFLLVGSILSCGTPNPVAAQEQDQHNPVTQTGPSIAACLGKPGDVLLIAPPVSSLMTKTDNCESMKTQLEDLKVRSAVLERDEGNVISLSLGANSGLYIKAKPFYPQLDFRTASNLPEVNLLLSLKTEQIDALIEKGSIPVVDLTPVQGALLRQTFIFAGIADAGSREAMLTAYNQFFVTPTPNITAVFFHGENVVGFNAIKDFDKRTVFPIDIALPADQIEKNVFGKMGDDMVTLEAKEYSIEELAKLFLAPKFPKVEVSALINTEKIWCSGGKVSTQNGLKGMLATGLCQISEVGEIIKIGPNNSLRERIEYQLREGQDIAQLWSGVSPIIKRINQSNLGKQTLDKKLVDEVSLQLENPKMFKFNELNDAQKKQVVAALGDPNADLGPYANYVEVALVPDIHVGIGLKETIYKGTNLGFPLNYRWLKSASLQ